MTSTVAVGSMKVPHRFIAFWMLSWMVPVLILSGFRFATASYLLLGWGFAVTGLLTVAAWFLVALLLSRLLRQYLGRYRIWIAATFFGATIGKLMGAFGHVWLRWQTNTFITGNGIPPDWAYEINSTIPIVFDSFISATILGLMQSLCFDEPTRQRLLWFSASSLCGILAAIVSVAIYSPIMRAMIELTSRAILSDGLIAGLTNSSLIMAVNLTIYGLLTGIVMRWFLLRNMRRREQAVVGQFD